MQNQITELQTKFEFVTEKMRSDIQKLEADLILLIKYNDIYKLKS